ncbi:hypothetical protein RhiJN_27275 [Ceratobasidium sp. AG-Ba]|nr:hypothetical protein RhiJN_13168 [Ceratobasidium sp. AG-Ba]QRV99256.1 hypothetical protein RhiJN_27275 [Ceratobasidium sp. AG-Ba]QRW13754.1 hypothetical protein RhiLY_12753 [Ceratobasidium sp. AG-Ba]
MRFTCLFAAAVALLPVAQVFAAPSRLPLPMKRELSLDQPLDERAAQAPVSLQDIIAGVRVKVDNIKSQLENKNSTAEVAATELKTTFDGFISDVQSLKKAKTAGVNAKLSLGGIFDPKSWPVVGDVYEIVKDILTLVDQIKTAASADTTGDKLQAIIDILGTIIKAAPSVISIVMTFLPFI